MRKLFLMKMLAYVRNFSYRICKFALFPAYGYTHTPEKVQTYKYDN